MTLEVEADDADAAGFEPVWAGNRRVGFVTSGGYGHTVGKSLAMAYVDRDAAGGPLEVHIVGAKRKCRVVPPSPYDPQGKTAPQGHEMRPAADNDNRPVNQS